MTIRSRTLGVYHPPTGIYERYNRGVLSLREEYFTNGEADVVSTQVTEGGEHGWHSTAARGKRDVGGAFSTQRKTFSSGAMPIVAMHRRSAGPDDRIYNGPLSVQPGDWPLAGYGAPGSSSTLDAAGTTAIARTIPTAPAADVSVMLGEIFREGVPRAIGAAMLKNRFRDYRDVGGEYLNYEFGWKPIVNDLKKVARAIQDSERILSQLERDSGRNVRRKFQFPTVYTTAQTQAAGRPYPALNTAVYTDQTKTELHSFMQRRWFSGCFTYHFERSGASRGRMQQAALNAGQLLGLELTPAVVWNLAPWSWLADWVTNAGDVMSNVSRFSQDGLVMRYGYVMEHTVQTRSISYEGGSYYKYPAFLPMPRTSGVFEVETKVRRKATPYGFGLDTGGFDPRQWAILGALGISRGPTNL